MASQDALIDSNTRSSLLLESSTNPGVRVRAKGDEVTGALLVDLSAGGSVTSVSVVSANGFAGSVANATTTPAITLSTTITGILQGNGTAISAASTTGSGSVVLQTSPTLITPVLGVATGTSLTLSNAGNVISATNTTDQASNQVLVLQGDRETPTTNDEIYQSWFLSSSTGVQREFGRITMSAPDVTNASEDGRYIFSVMVNGALGQRLLLSSTELRGTGNDQLTLGSASQSFADLFLASGAVVNFNNGNVVLTHTSGILTMGTGELRVTSAGTNTASVVTVGASQTLTSKTLTSPTITTASLSGTQLLAENASIGLDPSLSADGTWAGTTITATSGYSQAFGDLVYLDPTDGRWEAADANSAAGADGDARGILGMVVVAGTDGNACTILLNGVIRADANFPTFTVNDPIYVSETAGDVTQTQPTTTDVVIRIIGAALTADSMYFNPDQTWITHT